MPTPTYDSIADWYTAKMQEGGAGAWAFPTLLELIGEVEGQQICDLGCGEGRFARLLAQRGATVVGIDRSALLIKAAQRQEAQQRLGIHYCVEDAQSLVSIPDQTFDGVVCCLALMDIPDLDATLRTVQRVLKPDGWFVFLITHPCFASPNASARTADDGSVVWEIRRYFVAGFFQSERSGSLLAQVGAYHRTLATYLNALAAAGLRITHAIEPQRTGSVGTPNPGYSVVPLLLLMRCVSMPLP